MGKFGPRQKLHEFSFSSTTLASNLAPALCSQIVQSGCTVSPKSPPTPAFAPPPHLCISTRIETHIPWQREQRSWQSPGKGCPTRTLSAYVCTSQINTTSPGRGGRKKYPCKYLLCTSMVSAGRRYAPQPPFPHTRNRVPSFML